MDQDELFWTRIMPWRIPIWYVFSVVLRESMCIFAFGPSFTCCLFIQLFLLCSLGCLYFAPKLFCFHCIRLLVCLRAISPNLLVEFLLLFWNVMFCLYCFTHSRYLFNVPSFTSNFWLISSSWIVCFVCWVLWHINPCRLFNAKSIFM